MGTGRLYTAFVLASVSATAVPHDRPTLALRIRLLNRAGVPRRAVEGIEREAARLLGHAGIRLELRDCRPVMGFEPPGCDAPAAPAEVLVELLPGHCSSRDEILGYARPGLYAAVFVGRAEDLAREQIASREDILAHVIVHEATHMLTGGHTHSVAGIMHATWGLQDLRQIATRGQSLNAREIEGIRAAMARLDRPPLEDLMNSATAR
jgi:hypothetical protein